MCLLPIRGKELGHTASGISYGMPAGKLKPPGLAMQGKGHGYTVRVTGELTEAFCAPCMSSSRMGAATQPVTGTSSRRRC